MLALDGVAAEAGDARLAERVVEHKHCAVQQRKWVFKKAASEGRLCTSK